MEEFNDLIQHWKKGYQQKDAHDTQEIIKMAKQKKKQSMESHIYTIVILSLTLIVLILFFIYLAPMQDGISHIGIGLMTGGLVLRVFVEIMSIQKMSMMESDQNSKAHTNRMVRFYTYRNRIHGPLTYSILACYFIGFFLLVPEFSRYFSSMWMILMVGSFILIMGILVYIINKSTKEELEVLREFIVLKESLENSTLPKS
jgi:FtsH-binding integral membrane protein